jgi:hypothetical protein
MRGATQLTDEDRAGNRKKKEKKEKEKEDNRADVRKPLH